MPVQGLAAHALAAGLEQPEHGTCGSAVLDAARAIDDPAYAGYLVKGVDPLTGRQQAGSIQDRFRTESLAMHRRTNGPLDVRGHLQLPWPRALGTLPWSVARQLTAASKTRYDTHLVLPHRRSDVFYRVRAAIGAGHVVPVFVGNRLSARHVVLAIDTKSHGVVIYDPASGRRYPITRGEFVHARLAVAGWRVPWFVVVP
jgi:hypothetical protein